MTDEKRTPKWVRMLGLVVGIPVLVGLVVGGLFGLGARVSARLKPKGKPCERCYLVVSPATLPDKADRHRQDIDTDLWQLALLRRGWLNGAGDPIDRRVLREARELLHQLIQYGFPVPQIHALPSGGLQIDWDQNTIILEPHVPMLTVESRDHSISLSRNRLALAGDIAQVLWQ